MLICYRGVPLERLLQFAMCGSSPSGKYNPYEVTRPIERQRILILINSMPLKVEEIAEGIGFEREEVKEHLADLKDCGLIKEVEGKYYISFAIFTLEDQRTLEPLLKSLALKVKEIIKGRLDELRKLINDLECSKRDLKFPDINYIIVGALTLDYEALEVLKAEGLLITSKIMPGGGNTYSLALR